MRPAHTLASFALTSFLLTSTTLAQTPFEHQYGSTTLDVWTHPHPEVDGEFLVWTAEVGVRIRRFDTATDEVTFEEIDNGENITGALHGIFISDDLRWGFAVGSDGQAYWATDLSTPSKWHRMNPDSLTSNVHLWESIWDDAWEGSVWEREAWLAGESGTLLHKPAGSEAFTSVNFVDPLPADTHFLSMDFAEGTTIGVAGARMPDLHGQGADPVFLPAIYYTTDGLDWHAADVRVPNNWVGTFNYTGEIWVWAVDFVPGSTTDAYAVGGQGIGNGNGFTWHTTDSGQTWDPLYHTCEASPATCPPFQPLQPPDFACTGPVPMGAWGGLFENDSFATLYDVTALPDGSAVASGYAGGVFECPSFGGDWVDRANTTEFGTQPLWSVSNATSASTNEIWLGGAFGDLRTSRDGGATWQEEADDVLMRLQDVSFGSDTEGWVVGQFRRIMKSSNGGVDWTEQFMSLSGQWQAVEAIDDQIVVAVGLDKNAAGKNAPAVGYTSTGGGAPGNCGWTTSILTSLPDKSQLVDIDSYGLTASRPLGEFWAVGYTQGNNNQCTSGTGLSVPLVLRSIDGGQTWEQVPPTEFAPGFRPLGVAVHDEDTVVLVGRNECGDGAGYRCLDASGPIDQGTWNSIVPSSPVFPTLASVDMLATDEILVVGEDGAILRFNANTQVLTYIAGIYDASGATYGSHDWHKIDWVPGGVGEAAMIVIAGYAGNVLMLDGGWKQPHSQMADQIYGVSFRSKDLGWMTGLNTVGGLGVHTPNGFGDSSIVRFQR